MDQDSVVKWMIYISGSNPVSSSYNQDRCTGLTISNQRSGYITALLQIKS